MKHEDVKQALSQWVDDELHEGAAEETMKECVRSTDAKQSFESYLAIRAAIRGETSAHWQSGFSDRVAQAIANEPTVLAPRKSSKRSVFAGWAIAASVTLAVVFGAQWIPTSIESSIQPEQVANNSDTMLAEYHVTDDELAQLERINTLFNQFANQPTSTSQNNALPYVRLVSGEQVKTFRMTPQQFRQVMMELEKRNREAEQKAQEELNKQP
ncbi:sigma-E factor negative regulatory protein [Pleionea litopenaei]|uniref:Sigma-E factor negative regulatory protein n=1 Tax=Pleionea litopenaei TaxID=3070815 RepID=A0AA51RVU6_9GAMM|nr:sigma-E factor negative regulatory protein [Pleionea sp. HL-JVS1]WMS88591.1 sigma-E factor negative regulatory protein [Pleionea sp. HL-JVS1]